MTQQQRNIRIYSSMQQNQKWCDQSIHFQRMRNTKINRCLANVQWSLIISFVRFIESKAHMLRQDMCQSLDRGISKHMDVFIFWFKVLWDVIDASTLKQFGDVVLTFGFIHFSEFTIGICWWMSGDFKLTRRAIALERIVCSDELICPSRADGSLISMALYADLADIRHRFRACNLLI
jgi:hypothetical protein